MTLFESIIIAIVEGITEFLPISSTGHMIIAERFLMLPKDDVFTKLFTVAIQFGAILKRGGFILAKIFRFQPLAILFKTIGSCNSCSGVWFFIQR